VNECVKLAAFFFFYWQGYISDGFASPGCILGLEACQHCCRESGGSRQPAAGRGASGTARVRGSWLLAGRRVARCWPDARSASAAGWGKQFPSISDNFIGVY